jgi:hypothetical protein
MIKEDFVKLVQYMFRPHYTMVDIIGTVFLVLTAPTWWILFPSLLILFFMSRVFYYDFEVDKADDPYDRRNRTDEM